MKRLNILLIFAALIATLTVNAVPAKRVVKTVQLADGTMVELTLRGDEHFSYYTDADDNPCILHPDGSLEHITKRQVADTWTARRAERMDYQDIHRAAATTDSSAIRRSSSTTGTHRGLVILMEFTDEKFVTPNPQELFHRFFNEPGFSETGMSGSVKDYFMKQSYGQLNVDFDVVGPFTTNYAMAYYGGNDAYGNDQRPAYMALEAVDAAAAVVDYSNYDWNGDGYVDQVFIIYAGYAEAQGADANTIWPHEWTLYSGTRQTRRYNGKYINTYGCTAELKGNGRTNKGVIDGIGSACHEYSHCLGLPDTYDTEGYNFAMSYWDVMSGGNYNDDSRTPAGFTAYERMYAGWLTPTEINSQTHIENMQPLATTPEAYILYNDKNRNEYYLLENRQQVDFDRGLYGHGLLVVHVDYNETSWRSNRINVDANHQRMTIIPADNNFAETARGLQGDPWPGVSGNTSLTNYTTPAATLFNANIDGKKLMNKFIENISENTQAKTISFLACRPELAIPAPDDGTEIPDEAGFTITWPAVVGATSYQVEVTAIGTPGKPEEALQNEFDFSGCFSSSAGFIDISSSLANYGLSGWSGNKLYTTPYKLRIGTSATTGYLRTPTWQAPESQEITVVLGANTVKEGTAVKGNVRLAYGNGGGAATYKNAPFEVAEDGRLVFHFNVQTDWFWLDILPDMQMYVNYLAIYDGIWTAEQLGIGNASSAPHRASTIKTYTTGTNSYTLTGLNTESRYVYRLRAVGEDNWYSLWSEEKTFVFSNPTGMASPIASTDVPTVRYYDLQGREVSSDHRGLVIIKQGDTVRKAFK